MLLTELIGTGEVQHRMHDLSKSVNFLKMLLFLSFIVFARLFNPQIFSWLRTKGFSLLSSDGFTKDNPERYIPSILMLLLFSVLSISLFLTDFGIHLDYGNAVLVNMAICVFFISSILVLVNFLQSVLFSVRNVFNAHFIDLLAFFFILGAGAFLAVLATWFLHESYVILAHSIIYTIVAVVLLMRIVRLMVQGPQIFSQNLILIFFYLCAAEISPFLIIGKLLTNLI